MSLLRVELSAGSLHLPELGLWLDAHRAQVGAERVFVSHAHSDHIAAHREVLLTAPTAALMRTRIRGQRQEHVLEFNQTKTLANAETDFRLTLLHAGHILGSAMSLIEAGEESLLYTGDFKLRPGFAAESCEPRPADVLIMETTFGCPRYRFPPAAEVMADIIQFCRATLAGGETPMLLGYSLGKSQELLRGLTDAGLPIMLHGPAHKLAKIYEQFGQTFPPYERFDAATARGKVLICPPNSIGSAAFQSLGQLRTAMVTGWAMDSSCRFRSGTDAAFPLSDHADFAELIEMVERVQSKKIFTVKSISEFGLKPQISDLNSKQKRGQGDTLASRDYFVLRATNYSFARKNFGAPVVLTVAVLTVLTVVQTGVPLRLSVPSSVPWKVMMRSPLLALVE